MKMNKTRRYIEVITSRWIVTYYRNKHRISFCRIDPGDTPHDWADFTAAVMAGDNNTTEEN